MWVWGYQNESEESQRQGVGVVYRQLGGFDEAQFYHKQALTLSRQSGNRQGEARALNDLGVTAHYQRRFSESLSYHQQALEIRQSIGDLGELMNNLKAYWTWGVVMVRLFSTCLT